MKTKKLLLPFFLLLVFSNVFPCTTFVLKTKTQHVFGRNLDWVSENGVIVVNKRNIKKTSLVFPPDFPVSWISKYGSVTFNQFGKEFPYGGMNEKGLVIEIMNAQADYPTLDERKALNEVQWIQYQLDNAATIDEVLASNKLVRISPVEQELHFLLTDSTGETMVIEFINQRMMYYRGGSLPYAVLENDLYAQSIYNYKHDIRCRFSTAQKMVANYKETTTDNIIDYSFGILDKVALDGSWSIVYDVKNRKIYFKTATNRNVQHLDLNLFDYECKSPVLMYDLMWKNKGNVQSLFVEFESDVNKRKMMDAIKKNQILFSPAIAQRFYNYHKTCICDEKKK